MSEPNLAAETPQVSHRARAYKLEDDGASGMAHRKRDLKNSIANSRRSIAAIRDRQNGLSVFPALDQERAGYLITKHNEHIRACEEKIAQLRPGSPLIAPVTRRVAREDKRRSRRAKKDAKNSKDKP